MLVGSLVRWSPLPVKGFWVMWDNIYDYMCVLLYIFLVILDD
jgi:hypothetical protein